MNNSTTTEEEANITIQTRTIDTNNNNNINNNNDDEKKRNRSYYQKKSDIISGYKKVVTCRVDGCSTPCKNNYESRARVCLGHLKAESVRFEQDSSCVFKRFCQKCTKFEDLECFKGKRRACRASLAKLSSRRKDRLSLISATANTSLTSTTSRDNKEPRKTKTSDREYDMMIASKEEVISDEEGCGADRVGKVENCPR